MSIASEILALLADRNGIRTALINKGVSAAANHGYDDFADDIASIPTGGTYQSKSVRYTTNGSRTIRPDSGYDALSSVNVDVDVSGGEITLQSKSVTPTKNGMTVVPDSGYDGLSQVTVEGDSDLVPGNIKKDVTVFGVTGTFEGSGGGHSVEIDVSSGGLISAECGGVIATHQLSNSDDADFIAGNIKKDVNIFGITGTYEGSGGGENGLEYDEETNTAGGITAIITTTSVGMGMEHTTTQDSHGGTVEEFSGLENGKQAGSLIVSQLSTVIDRVVAEFGSDTVTGLISNHYGYFNIPYPYQGLVTIKGYAGPQLITSGTVTITGISKYECPLIL